MTDEHKDRIAAAKDVVGARQADLDKGLSVAPAHTRAGIPTTPLSGLHPQVQALQEAQNLLLATEDEPATESEVVTPAPAEHPGYADAADAIESGDLEQYRGRAAVVTRGSEHVLIEVAGTIVAMVCVPADSDEATERGKLENYLT